MKVFKKLFFFSAFFACHLLHAQVKDGPAFCFEYAIGQGSAPSYNTIIREYFHAFPWMTDTAALSSKRQGISFGASAVNNRLFYSGRAGGFKASGWDAGMTPGNGQSNEAIMVKTQFIDVNAAFFFIKSDWFRMGIGAGLSFNIVKIRRTGSFAAFTKAKEGKYIWIAPTATTTNNDLKRFFSIKFGLPVAFGRKHALCVEPFYSLPLWGVDTSHIRDQMIPNSTPAYPKSSYKGTLPYWGVRFSICFGVDI
ncbi:hypothetical protein BH09BAC5_BH09BAC5_10350 [soil metagenome]